MDKIICLGKNYLDHALELGDAVPEKPVLFLKPPSTLIPAPLPRIDDEIHPEAEIVFKISCTHNRPQFTHITLGLDFTLRKLQTKLKKQGHPWEISKVFPGSSFLCPWIDLQEFLDYPDCEFRFFVNGQLRQSGKARQMRMNPEACLEYIQSSFPICDGDIVFTGTPAGVSCVQPGDEGLLEWGSRLSQKVRFF